MPGLSELCRTAPCCRPSRARRGCSTASTPGHKKPIEMTSGDPKEADAGLRHRQVRGGQGAARHLSAHPRLRRAAQGDRRLDRPALSPAHGGRLRARGAAAQRLARGPVLRGAAGRRTQELSPAGPSCCCPIPFYQAYLGGTYGTGCEPVYLNATAETGHLPDLDALAREPDILRRAAAFFLCTPANPQGSVAGRRLSAQGAGAGARIRLHAVPRRVLLGDLHARAADRRPRDRRRARRSASRTSIVFNSLSKRSNLPGMRSGFAAGDGDFLETLAEIRNLDGAADAGARAARLGGGLVGGAARRRRPPGLSRQVRRVRRAARRAASAIAGPAAASSCGST